MKKARLSVSLFLVAFVFTYIGSCYFVPGWQIKLEADSLTYFLESLKKLAPIKFLVSLIVGVIISSVPALIQKMKSNTD